MKILIIAIVFLFCFAISLINYKKARKENLRNSLIFMEELIRAGELSQTAYQNIEIAFYEFDTMGCSNDPRVMHLWYEFQFKYKDFSPYYKGIIHIVPTGTGDYYNYKIIL